MLFNSFDFLIFLVVVLLVLPQLPRRGQNVFLLIGSYVFYAAWDVRFLSLLFISTTIDYFCGLRIHRCKNARLRRVYLFLSLTANLGLLGFFKYANFFLDNMQSLLRTLGLHVNDLTLQIILPLGVSFYTFQTLSYTLDIYRRKADPAKSLLDFALYVTFFPQLVAGPIEKSTDLLPQIEKDRNPDSRDYLEGFDLMLWGFFKKVVVADNLALHVQRIFSQSSCSSAEVVIGTLAFAFQIYADFSGYTDIARGVARLMGFRLRLNFSCPYFATSPQDFWHRWHISLSDWLREYLYFSLGGSRKGHVRTYVNLSLTMLLGGLWHGAAWNFVVWGFYHGLLLVVHRVWARHFFPADEDEFHPSPDNPPALNRWSSFKIAKWLGRVAFMFMFTLYGWLIFRVESLGQLVNMTASLLNLLDVSQWRPMLTGVLKLMPFVVPMMLFDGWSTCAGSRNPGLRHPVLAVCWWLGLLYGITILGVFGEAQFIYFQF